jgi:regulation of enolase protein 1 (concanavalin A-like superfamily)
VGSPRLPGSAAYNGFSKGLAMSAAGVNLWGARDEFHFVWKKLAGNFLVQARVELLGKGVEAHRKLGVMVRSTLDPDSPYADGAVHGDGLTSLQFRRSKGAETEEIRSTLTGADVLQIERHGKRITLRAARFGEPFVTTKLDKVDLGNEVYVGLFLCSHNPDVVERAIFRDVRLTRPVKDGFQPYRDYIGSRLEILDVETGRRTLLYASAQPFEAPNWEASRQWRLEYRPAGTLTVWPFTNIALFTPSALFGNRNTAEVAGTVTRAFDAGRGSAVKAKSAAGVL